MFELLHKNTYLQHQALPCKLPIVLTSSGEEPKVGGWQPRRMYVCKSLAAQRLRCSFWLAASPLRLCLTVVRHDPAHLRVWYDQFIRDG